MVTEVIYFRNLTQVISAVGGSRLCVMSARGALYVDVQPGTIPDDFWYTLAAMIGGIVFIAVSFGVYMAIWGEEDDRKHRQEQAQLAHGNTQQDVEPLPSASVSAVDTDTEKTSEKVRRRRHRD